MMTRKKVSIGSLGNSSVISSSRLPIYNPEQQANVITIVFQLQLPIPLFMQACFSSNAKRRTTLLHPIIGSWTLDLRTLALRTFDRRH